MLSCNNYPMPNSIVSSLVSEMVLEKNTFLEVPIISEEDEQALPRTISDQTHSRLYRPRYFGAFAPILEERPPSVSSSSVQTPEVSPVFVSNCRWHTESTKMGSLTDEGRRFTKESKYDGRLSMLTEDQMKESGIHRYLVRIEDATVNFSAADGFGFVFGDRLPCKKNIQVINSLFINKRGQACTRLHAMETVKHGVAHPIDKGMSVEIVVDLDNCGISFSVLDNKDSLLGSTSFNFGDVIQYTGGKRGFFCAVIKHADTTVSFR